VQTAADADMVRPAATNNPALSHPASSFVTRQSVTFWKGKRDVAENLHVNAGHSVVFPAAES
jgi:hypothetical protein